jgi:hypothetical protein
MPTYTSVWDTGEQITTQCKFDGRRVYDIESVEVDGIGTLVDEYVTTKDGRQLREEDGVQFDY